MNLENDVFGKEMGEEQPQQQDDADQFFDEEQPRWKQDESVQLVQVVNKVQKQLLQRVDDLTKLESCSSQVLRIVVDDSCKLIAVQSMDQRVRVFQQDGKLLYSQLVKDNRISSLCFVRDTLFSAINAKKLVEYNIKQKQCEVLDVKSRQNDRFNLIVPLFDAVVASTQMHQLSVILRNQVLKQVFLQFHVKFLCSCESLVVVSDGRLNIQILDFNDEFEVKSTHKFMSDGFVTSLAICQQFLCVGTQSGKIYVYDVCQIKLNEKKPIKILSNETTPIGSVSINSKHIFYSSTHNGGIYNIQNDEFEQIQQSLRATAAVFTNGQLLIGKATGEIWRLK